MSETKKNLELLPQGAFLITLDKDGNDKIKGRFSMYVLDRFCESRDVKNYITLLERITVGMSVGDYADLVLMALEDYHRKNPAQLEKTKADVMDMIDDRLGGIAGEEFTKLIRHAVGRVADIKQIEEVASAAPRNDEEKKSELKPGLNDGLSGNEPGSAE